jgi:hypothetical protein
VKLVTVLCFALAIMLPSIMVMADDKESYLRLPTARYIPVPVEKTVTRTEKHFYTIKGTRGANGQRGATGRGGRTGKQGPRGDTGPRGRPGPRGKIPQRLLDQFTQNNIDTNNRIDHVKEQVIYIQALGEVRERNNKDELSDVKSRLSALESQRRPEESGIAGKERTDTEERGPIIRPPQTPPLSSPDAGEWVWPPAPENAAITLDPQSNGAASISLLQYHPNRTQVDVSETAPSASNNTTSLHREPSNITDKTITVVKQGVPAPGMIVTLWKNGQPIITAAGKSKSGMTDQNGQVTFGNPYPQDSRGDLDPTQHYDVVVANNGVMLHLATTEVIEIDPSFNRKNDTVQPQTGGTTVQPQATDGASSSPTQEKEDSSEAEIPPKQGPAPNTSSIPTWVYIALGILGLAVVALVITLVGQSKRPVSTTTE